MDYIALDNAGLGLSKVGLSIINGGKLTFSGEDVYFDKNNPDILWNTKYTQLESEFKLRTLRFLSSPLLEYEKSKDEDCKFFFESYLGSFIHLMKPHELIRKLASEDHALYIRTILFIKALMVFPDTWELRDGLIDLMVRQGTWMADDKNYKKNNHGVMMDFGLLHLSVLFQEYDFSKQYCSKALARIKKMFVDSFDDDGFHNENTIMYLNFNIQLFKHIVLFCTHYKLDEGLLTLFSTTLNNAENALRHLIWQDGTIPPIGDGGQSKPKYVSINKSKFFNAGNFALIKNEDVYFTLKCGWTTYIHKHIDEASITLRYKNKDLIIDSGKFNYDKNGPRPKLVSFGGHSTIYPLKYEATQLSEMIKHYSTAQIETYEQNADVTTVNAKYSLEEGDISVSRGVEFKKEHHITITDEWQCKKPHAFRQRFVLPGCALVNEVPMVGFHVINGEQQMYIRIASASVDVKIQITRGEVSPVDFKIADAWFVDIDTGENMKGSVVVEILFGEQAADISHMDALPHSDYELLNQYQQELSDLRKKLTAIQCTFSWRITKPLRYIGSILQKIAKS